MAARTLAPSTTASNTGKVDENEYEDDDALTRYAHAQDYAHGCQE
jgi:hypothetical protein